MRTPLDALLALDAALPADATPTLRRAPQSEASRLCRDAPLPAPPHDADDLFPPQTALLPLPPMKWRGCAVCGRDDSPPAHKDHDVCRRCATYPVSARQSLTTQLSVLFDQRTAAVAALDAASATLNAPEQAALRAWQALSAEEQQRWARYQDALARRRAGEQGIRGLDATIAAYADAADTRIPSTLRRYAAAVEAPGVGDALRRRREADDVAFWAIEAYDAGSRRIAVQVAQLEIVLDDLD